MAGVAQCSVLKCKNVDIKKYKLCVNDTTFFISAVENDAVRKNITFV